ncbi:MAG: 3'(2'),5'-bisphosphate nucleotidase [Zetaproteobacteria bacterium]|nr:MAG: 3'(2'),5'-bisphosphate nucleotidase [Zetaproteobacteria bacterium]
MEGLPKILLHRAALCNMVRRIAVDAGELILEYFDGIRDVGVTTKADGSIVTQADQEAERLIEKKLLEILPDIPVVGEESFASGVRIDFSKHDFFWLVDPLDGTRAFAAGDPNFTVNIALIYKGDPVLGVIYAPESGELYAGYLEEDGSGKAVRYFEDSETEKDMQTRRMPKNGLVIMSSHYSRPNDALEAMLENLKINKIIRRFSSIKICVIANGKADLYPRFGPTCEWDTAAGHAILRAAGGDIRDMKGNTLKYGGDDPKLLNPEFIAASGEFFRYVE